MVAVVTVGGHDCGCGGVVVVITVGVMTGADGDCSVSDGGGGGARARWLHTLVVAPKGRKRTSHKALFILHPYIHR